MENEKVEAIELEQLEDKDIAVLVKCSDYIDYLSFLKQNSNRPPFYAYSAQLGRFNPNSEIVKKSLPNIATKLYRKHEPKSTTFVELCYSYRKNDFEEAFKTVMNSEITQELLSDLSYDDAKSIIKKLAESYKDNAFDLFLVGSKMFGVTQEEVFVGLLIEQLTEKKEEEPVKEVAKTKKRDKKKVTPDKDESEKDENKDEILADTENKEKTLSEETKTDTSTLEESLPKTEETKTDTIDEIEIEKDRVSTDEMLGDIAKLIGSWGHPKKTNLVPEKKDEVKEAVKEEDKNTSESNEDDKVEQDDTTAIKEKNTVVEEAPPKKELNAYIGYVDIRANYYNFCPIGEIDGYEFIPYKPSELDSLLPHSKNRNINLYYNIWDNEQSKFVQKYLYQGQTLLFMLKVDDLEQNIDKSTGVLNATGYKTPAIVQFKNGKIKQMYKEGFYQLKTNDILIDDIEAQKTVRIDYENIVEGDHIVINLKDGFYAGPYEVKYSTINDSYFIRPQVQENRYYISGYRASDYEKITIEQDVNTDYETYEPQVFFYVRPGASAIYKDIISDEDLLAALRDIIEKKNASLNDVDVVLDLFKNSPLVGNSIPSEIKNGRFERLKEILSSNKDADSTLAIASDIICGLILRGEDEDKANAIIDKIIEERDILDRIQSFKVIKERIDDTKRELDDLAIKKQEITDDINNIAEISKKKLAEETEKTDQVLNAKKDELREIEEKLSGVSKAKGLMGYIDELEGSVSYLESHKSRLESDTRNLESKFVELVNRYSDKIVDLAFDGYMSSKMLQAAARWEEGINKRSYNEIISAIKQYDADNLNEKDLLDYLIKTIQIARPQYGRNTIVNILTCTMQGFLTVFSGAPGCGKTSICNIVAKVLGLEKFEEIVVSDTINVNRFIPVSVEHGWTSKRDFIGYYNPLTKSFEESNREVFDGLKMLDAEVKSGESKYPYIILLDEANLSPIEYYWADFMNVCDDVKKNNKINLGSDNILSIPDTLHFVATINNDDTTTTLSPRLVDRAWVVTLPKLGNAAMGKEISDQVVKIIPWESLKKCFIPDSDVNLVYDDKTQKIYGALRSLLNNGGMTISPRVEIAMRKYWKAASVLMEDDEDTQVQKEIVAFDYSVAQKILPKINGSGDDYLKWLTDLKGFCHSNNLNRSEGIISGIIERGNINFKYYQFF